MLQSAVVVINGAVTCLTCLLPGSQSEPSDMLALQPDDCLMLHSELVLRSAEKQLCAGQQSANVSYARRSRSRSRSPGWRSRRSRSRSRSPRGHDLTSMSYDEYLDDFQASLCDVLCALNW